MTELKELLLWSKCSGCSSMGNDESKSPGGSSASGSVSSAVVDFPNAWRSSEVRAWTLLHQCTLDKWTEGHAEAAGFPETVLTCDGQIHKDCSMTFCINRQGIININKTSSIFSFRKRSKFTKMAEHFEYNHIPAQLSSIQHFHVKSVLCFKDNLVVLHLVRNMATQFGLLNLRTNKFLGVFGKQNVEFVNEVLAGQISPDKTKCLIKIPDITTVRPLASPSHIFQLYDLASKALLSQVALNVTHVHFAFDPRFKATRVAVTNFELNQLNSLSLVRTDTWGVLATNTQVDDTRNALYPFMKDLMYTREGSLIIATLVDTACHCREKKSRNYQPINCSIFVFNSDNTDTLYCIKYQRYTCGRHLCPVNYTPVFSHCGNRMAIVMNVTELPMINFVHVYKLPPLLSLQAMCRVIILQHFSKDKLTDLPLPLKLINFLHFKPEFN